MSNKDIFTKIKNVGFYLNKISAKKINKEPADNTIDMDQDAVCTILENSKNNLSIKVNTKTSLKPEALFSVEMEYIMELEFNEEMTEKEIEDNINEIVTPLGAVSSYIIASITKEMLGSHIILPPTINVSKVKWWEK